PATYRLVPYTTLFRSRDALVRILGGGDADPHRGLRRGAGHQAHRQGEAESQFGQFHEVSVVRGRDRSDRSRIAIVGNSGKACSRSEEHTSELQSREKL